MRGELTSTVVTGTVTVEMPPATVLVGVERDKHLHAEDRTPEAVKAARHAGFATLVTALLLG